MNSSVPNTSADPLRSCRAAPVSAEPVRASSAWSAQNSADLHKHCAQLCYLYSQLSVLRTSCSVKQWGSCRLWTQHAISPAAGSLTFCTLKTCLLPSRLCMVCASALQTTFEATIWLCGLDGP